MTSDDEPNAWPPCAPRRTTPMVPPTSPANIAVYLVTADGWFTRREVSRDFVHHAVHSGVLEDFLRDHDAVTSDPA